MNPKTAHILIVALLCALFAWIYLADHYHPPAKPVEVQRVIRSGPPRNEPHIVSPRKWDNWREPEVHDCVAPKAWVTFTVDGKPVDYGLWMELVRE